MIRGANGKIELFSVTFLSSRRSRTLASSIILVWLVILLLLQLVHCSSHFLPLFLSFRGTRGVSSIIGLYRVECLLAFIA